MITMVDFGDKCTNFEEVGMGFCKHTLSPRFEKTSYLGILKIHPFQSNIYNHCHSHSTPKSLFQTQPCSKSAKEVPTDSYIT